MHSLPEAQCLLLTGLHSRSVRRCALHSGIRQTSPAIEIDRIVPLEEVIRLHFTSFLVLGSFESAYLTLGYQVVLYLHLLGNLYDFIFSRV
jgi:hypothetical protein